MTRRPRQAPLPDALGAVRPPSFNDDARSTSCVDGRRQAEPTPREITSRHTARTVPVDADVATRGRRPPRGR